MVAAGSANDGERNHLGEQRVSQNEYRSLGKYEGQLVMPIDVTGEEIGSANDE